MSFEEIVDILVRTDYDRKHGPYRNPNGRKAKIIAKVVRSLHRNFGVRRNKDQLGKRWSDLKLKEEDQYGKIRKVLRKMSLDDTQQLLRSRTCRKYCVKFLKRCRPQVMWMLGKTKLISAVQVHKYLSVSSWQ